MSDATMGSAPAAGRDLSNDTHPATIPVFVLLLVCGIGYAVYGLLSDINNTGQSPLAIGAFVLLGLALLIALGFEFVNGFHDTANAVATVIYTNSLPAPVAVVCRGYGISSAFSPPRARSPTASSRFCRPISCSMSAAVPASP